MAISHKLFDLYPQLKQEINDIGLFYESAGTRSFNIYEEAQYRHVYWKPGRVRSKFKYRTYYVYTPAAKYCFRYGRHLTSVEKLHLTNVRFVEGPRRGERKGLANVVPNRACMGNIDLIYKPQSNNLSNLIDSYWLAGMNMDYALRSKFYERLCVLDGYKRLPLARPGFALFERWEALTPEEVVKLCKPEGLAQNA